MKRPNTKAMINCGVTMQLIWAFVFAYAKSRFSHDAAQLQMQGFDLGSEVKTEAFKTN